MAITIVNREIGIRCFAGPVAVGRKWGKYPDLVGNSLELELELELEIGIRLKKGRPVISWILFFIYGFWGFSGG